MRQAESLADIGHTVDVVLPDVFTSTQRKKHSRIRIIEFDAVQTTQEFVGFVDASVFLYREERDPGTYGFYYTDLAASLLQSRLAKRYDAILLWENPVPFLKKMYPEAKIIHQMPGAFSRPPYPHTVVCDSGGLFKSDTLYSNFLSNFHTYETEVDSELKTFIDAAKSCLKNLPVWSENESSHGRKNDRLYLVPLQVSEHYAFQVDTGYSNQSDLLTDIVDQIPSDVDVVVTQYISRLYADRGLTSELQEFLNRGRRSVLYDPLFERVPTVSQHLLPLIDGVAAASSSVAVQALLWGVDIKIAQPTHLELLNDPRFESEAVRTAFLHSVLERHQPLAHKATDDPKFLTQLIEAHGTASTEPDLPKFTDIEPGYWRHLNSNFRYIDARRGLVKAGIKLNSTTKAEQFESFLSEGSFDLVSFDLFDTLAQRPVEAPADTYRLLEDELRGEGWSLPIDFAQLRLQAELDARDASPDEEITLNEIYAQFARLSGLERGLVEEISARERALEVRLVDWRPIGRKMWDVVRVCDIPCCITSDMYLPRATIDQMLRKLDIPDTVPLYLSSEMGVTKKTGNLFRRILSDTNLSASQILHVGDNISTDVRSAEGVSIRPFHVPKAVEYLRSNRHYAKNIGKRQPIDNIGRSVVISNIARRVFDDPRNAFRESVTNGSTFNLGYAAVGPILLGYVLWLRSRAQAKNIDHLFFLSREGRLIKDAFDIVEEVSPIGIKGTYLLCSRRTAQIAAIRTTTDIVEVALNPLGNDVDVATALENRFGIDSIHATSERLKAAGFETTSDFAGGRNQNKFIRLVQELSDVIIETAASERSAYEKYLEGMGFLAANRPAVVDIGWKANMQGALGKIRGSALTGFYLATLDAARRWTSVGHDVEAYHSNFCITTLHSGLVSHRLFIEHFWCDSSPSLERFCLDDEGRASPVFKPVARRGIRLESSQEIHKAALALVEDIGHKMPEFFRNYELEATFADRFLEQFVSGPTKRDASIFTSRAFEDVFGGVSEGAIIACSSERVDVAGSYWKPGARAVSGGGNAEDDPTLDGQRRADSAKHAGRLTIIRRRLILGITGPFVRPQLGRKGRREWAEDPTSLFRRTRHPMLKGIGRLAGFV